MGHKLDGYVADLAALPIAGLSNGDTADVWLGNARIKMVFDSTSTNATAVTPSQAIPYSQRPDDYGAGPGVWVEDVGAYQLERLNGTQLIGSTLRSINWGTSQGSEFDLDAGTIKLGGSSSPAFSVTAAGVLTATGANISGAITASTIDIGGADATSFHVDTDGNVWAGAATYNIATNPFAVSNAGAMRAGGFAINATDGIYSGSGATRVQMKPGVGFWTGATAQADALNYLDVDGSGWLANKKIEWTAAGAITLDVPANVGTGVGIVYKGGKRWLYDFNPGYGASAQPDGNNTFLGVECGNLTMGSTATSTQNASYNVGIGYRVLYSATGAHHNVGLGNEALFSLTSAHSCVGIGNSALHDNTVGYQNIGVGRTALAKNIDGYSNIGIGYSALYYNESGYQNIGIGDHALSGTSGYDNIGIGMTALSSTTTGFDVIGIGHSAGAYQNNGSSALLTPEHSIYLGAYTYSGSDPAGGEDEITNEIVIGFSTTGNGSNTVTLGNTSISEFHCQVALTVDSDIRIKRNINPNILGLSFINALNPIIFQQKNPFDYPDEFKPPEFKDRLAKEKDWHGKSVEKLIKANKRPDDNNRKYLGLAAQDVESVLERHGANDLHLVSTSNRGKKAITYEGLIMPLISAVQELSEKVDAIEPRI